MLRGDMRSQPGQKRREIKENTLRITLSRMKRRGLVDNSGGTWKIVPRGKTFHERRLAFQETERELDERRRRKKNMIVAFDVPEDRRAQRNWLRSELVVFGFEPLQKSVWFGPGPLPRDFINRLGELGLLSCIKFFKAVSDDVV
tara:strand:- start:2297 stop:2728 length:432 start_codon:yes stop_codon:yes gene_type:complete